MSQQARQPRGCRAAGAGGQCAWWCSSSGCLRARPPRCAPSCSGWRRRYSEKASRATWCPCNVRRSGGRGERVDQVHVIFAVQRVQLHVGACLLAMLFCGGLHSFMCASLLYMSAGDIHVELRQPMGGPGSSKHSMWASQCVPRYRAKIGAPEDSSKPWRGQEHDGAFGSGAS